MGNTLYGSFADSALAEKAVGALLDHGVRAEDVSVVHSHPEATNASTPYEGTSPIPVNEQAWTGENRNVEANRIGYSGAAYDTLSAPPAATPSAREVAYESTTYGNTAAGTVGEPIRTGSEVYPDARVVENRSAMTDGAVGHDPNDWKRADHENEGDVERAAKTGISTTTAADAGAGAVKGIGWGAGLGILAAIAALTVPGVGLVIGGGALAAALGGAAATAGAGAVVGGITGYLKDQGMDEHVAAEYERNVQNGGAMVAVTYPSGKVEESEIRELLEKYGAVSMNPATRGYVS